MENEIVHQYGNQVRVRACGLCFRDDKLLMINHRGLHHGDFWAPPGGGVEFGHQASQTIVREFEEETGLTVKPGAYLFSTEFIKPPLHALELFFEVTYLTGQLKIGHDPETKDQIIKEVRWLTPSEIQAIPENNRHGIFKHCKNPLELPLMRGLWSI